MPTCIYCKATTTCNEPEDHPIPQALGTNAYPLTRGDVCGPCNVYLGDLDRNLCDHHHIAGMIVFGNLHGTDGRIRRTIHAGFVFDRARGHLEVGAESASIEDGVLVTRHAGNEKFDEWKFSRGLHRIALGALARQAGADEVLADRYDAVRRYIREPRARTEYWPYFQRPSDRRLGNRSMPPALAAQGFLLGFAVGDSATYVYLNLFVSEFILALNGDVATLTDHDRERLASAADAPVPRSTRPWLFRDSAQAGEEIELEPTWFRDNTRE